MKTKSNLKQALENKRFVITAETSPPDAADAESVLKRAGCLKNVVDAVNVTDGAGAKPHMSALATAAILAQNGIEPVLQFTTNYLLLRLTYLEGQKRTLMPLVG